MLHTSRAIVMSTFGAAVVAIVSPSSAAPLTGFGAHLPLPASGFPAMQDRTLTPGPGSRWTGSWTAPAASPWVGSYEISGTIPSNFPAASSGPGNSVYDFTSLSGGELPIGTFFVFYDLDLGEEYDFRAFDSAGNLITTPWLDEPVGVMGAGSGGAPIALTDLPRWSFSSGTYFFDALGQTPGNDTDIEFVLTNNTRIATMRVFRSSTFTEFRLAAPLAVPAPGAAIVAAAGIPWLVRRRRTRALV